MLVELLYFDGCPSWQAALANLRTVLGEEAPIKLIRVADDADAVRQRFTGSPTIRVEGEDLFPTGQQDYALGCRIYHSPDGLRGWPTPDMIRAALEARGKA